MCSTIHFYFLLDTFPLLILNFKFFPISGNLKKEKQLCGKKIKIGIGHNSNQKKNPLLVFCVSIRYFNRKIFLNEDLKRQHNPGKKPQSGCRWFASLISLILKGLIFKGPLPRTTFDWSRSQQQLLFCSIFLLYLLTWLSLLKLVLDIYFLRIRCLTLPTLPLKLQRKLPFVHHYSSGSTSHLWLGIRSGNCVAIVAFF